MGRCRSQTTEAIDTKFGKNDYVVGIYSQQIFGLCWVKGFPPVNMRNIQLLAFFLRFCFLLAVSCWLQPKANNRFRWLMGQKTCFRCRMCLLGVRTSTFKFLTLKFAKNSQIYPPRKDFVIFLSQISDHNIAGSQVTARL